MAYLTTKKVKGITYYQVVESYWEGGRSRQRMLLHLGKDLLSADSLLRWWNYLGQPPIAYKPGRPHHHGELSLTTPAETIVGLDKFLDRATVEECTLAVEGLKFLTG